MPTKEVTISFLPSKSLDVVGYRVYFEEVPNSVTYTSSFLDIGNRTVLKASELPITEPGTYRIGITSIDKVGNESTITLSKKNLGIKNKV